MPPAVADLQVEAIRVLDVEALEPIGIVCGNGVQAALPEFLLNGLGVPRLDHKAKALHDSAYRRSGAVGPLRCNEGLDGCPPEYDGTPVTHVHHHARALIDSDSPAH